MIRILFPSYHLNQQIMDLNIVKHPADILQTETEEMKKEDITKKETQNLIDNMIETMHRADGVGIAGPQVNQEKRLCIIGKHCIPKERNNLPLEDSGDMPLVNPEWKKIDNETHIDQEGCLSIPHTFGKVKRYKNIEVSALDRDGNEINFQASDYLARVIQHETDHLNGVLFIEKASDIKEIDPIKEAIRRKDQ